MKKLDGVKSNMSLLWCIGAMKAKESIRYYHCGSCNKQFSVTDKYNISRYTITRFKNGFLLLFVIITNVKKDINSRELARQLDINKDTARRMQIKIRESMQDKGQATSF